jgi:hypothetical protein
LALIEHAARKLSNAANQIRKPNVIGRKLTSARHRGDASQAGSPDVDQMPLHLSIAFFGIQIAAWAGLGVYLHLTHRRAADTVSLTPAASTVTSA